MDKSRVCRLQIGAQPIINVQKLTTSDMDHMKVCRICFATNYRLYNMTEYNNLVQAYTVLTGLSPENDDNLPPYLCTECAHRLLNCVHFRTRSLQAHLILLEIIKKHEKITLKSIRAIIGDEGSIGTHMKVTKTVHFDLNRHYLKKQDEITENKINVTDNVSGIKIEKDDVIYITNNEYKANDHLEHSRDLHEDYNIKIDTDDFSCQDANEDDSIKYFPNLNKSNYLKDTTEDEDILNISVNKVVGDICEDNDINYVVERNRCDNGEVTLLMVKNPQKNLINDQDQEPSTAAHKPREYVTRNKFRIIADQLIIKPAVTKYKVPQDLSPASIVKLRKRVRGEKTDGIMLYDKVPYQTINDVPSWGRLKNGTAIKPFSCRICKFKTGYRKELMVHEKKHCETPDAKTIERLDVARKSHGKTVFCDDCKQVFSNKSHFYKHIEIASGCKPYSCNVCKKQFKFYYELDIHNRLHGGGSPIYCSICKKTFNFQTSLTLHIRSIHPRSIKKVKLDERLKKEKVKKKNK